MSSGEELATCRSCRFREPDKRPEYAAQMIPDEARITEAQSESLHNALIASCDEFVPPIHLPDEARIAALEAENTRLREALAPFAYAAFGADGYPDEEAFTLVLRPDAEEYDDGDLPERESLITARQLRLARHRLQSTAAAFCVSSTDINTVCEQPEGVSVTTTAPEGGPDAAIVTGGQYDRDDFGPIGEAARRICSYTEGEARRNVYKVAKTELTALRAERDALREALKSAAENLSWAARMMKGNCRGSDVDAVNLAAGHATEARAALDRKESGNEY